MYRADTLIYTYVHSDTAELTSSHKIVLVHYLDDRLMRRNEVSRGALQDLPGICQTV
jgi:hypothetical protein